MKNGAIAVFVKTPGLSPVKTRLGQAIGKSSAEVFYALSVEATQAVIFEVIKRSTLIPMAMTGYWAVAESEGVAHPMWDQLAVIFQSDGELGRRLNCVYGELIKKYDFVILIGGDCPQIPLRRIFEAILFLSEGGNRFVLGPAEDGGFYLFGGTSFVAEEIWMKVPYSQTDTLSKIRQALMGLGETRELGLLRDIDTLDDLKALSDEKHDLIELLPSQRRVIEWSGKFTKFKR